MANPYDINPDFIPKRMEEFEKQYRLLTKFGVEALQNHINSKTQRTDVDANFVLNVLSSVTEDLMTKKLAQAQDLLALEQVPRVNKPTPQDALDQNEALSAEKRARVKPNPAWLRNADFAAAAQIIANQINSANPDQNAITSQFDKLRDAAENAAKNEYRNRLTMKMAPKPGKKVEPKPYGM